MNKYLYECEVEGRFACQTEPLKVVNYDIYDCPDGSQVISMDNGNFFRQKKQLITQKMNPKGFVESVYSFEKEPISVPRVNPNTALKATD